ncbi:MAG TPA: GNAT family N-acetyltransferase [Caulobacteraceae bacterium]|nr:GNAT family N-acetyltransferase [Caulobacteraceae bacterium]
MSEAISVGVAQRGEQPLLEGLMQFYIYDFSELEPDGSDDLDFNAAGRFEPYPYLPDYWREADRLPLLIRRGGKPVGFALLNAHSHLGEPVDHNMAEFFVARKHRRHGVASEAVRQVLARYPGRWEVAVAARNKAALAFWPRAIAAAPNVSDLVRREGDGASWKGPIWTFRAG